MTNEELKAQFPAIEFAYPLAVNSYEVALKRLDAIDGRLQTIIAFIVASSAVVPSIAAGRGIHFRSLWFYIAVISFLLAVGIGVYGRIKGKVRVFAPRQAFNHWLHKPEWEFKKDFIAFAAADFEENNTLIVFKWKCTVALSFLFLLQVASLVAWVVGNS